MPRRWSAVVVACAAAFAFVVPAAAQAPTPAQSTPPLVRVASIAPWTDRSHPFTLVAQISNPTELSLENASLRISIFARVSSRSELRQSLDRGPPTEAIGTLTQPVASPIPPGGQQTIAVNRPAAALLGVIARTGVYPIQIELRHSRGTFTVNTAMPYLSSPPKVQLNVAWILPIEAPTAIGPDGTYSFDAIQRLEIAALTQQMQVLAARPGVAVTLAPSPALLDTLADLSDGFRERDATGVTALGPQSPFARAAATLLDLFRRTALSTGEVATVPYAPIDAPSLAQHGLRGDLLRQLLLGRSAAQAHLGRTPSPAIVAPFGSAIDDQSASVLATLGLGAVVVDPSTLPVPPSEPFQPGLFGPSRPVALGPSGMRALLADPPLSARLQGTEQGVLLAQAIIAETASSWLELPAFAGERLLIIGSPGLPAPPALAAALDGLLVAPWVHLRTASDALRSLPPAGVPLPLPKPVRKDRPFLLAARRTRRVLSTIGQITASLPDVGRLDRLTLLSESAEWTSAPEGGVALARGARAEALAILEGIQVATGQRVTLTSRTGRHVPVTILNRNRFPVRVLVSLDSVKAGFPRGRTQVMQIPPGNATLDFTIEARAAGSFPIDVSVLTPDGRQLITRGRLTLRSSAVSLVALVVVGGSTGFLLLAWVRRARRRERIAIAQAASFEKR